MVIFPLTPDQTIAQMWSNGARGGVEQKTIIVKTERLTRLCLLDEVNQEESKQHEVDITKEEADSRTETMHKEKSV